VSNVSHSYTYLVSLQGAQTDAYAFAYSSPNPTLARKTWNPPISMEELKDRVVNIKPDPDMVSSLGDLVPMISLCVHINSTVYILSLCRRHRYKLSKLFT